MWDVPRRARGRSAFMAERGRYKSNARGVHARTVPKIAPAHGQERQQLKRMGLQQKPGGVAPLACLNTEHRLVRCGGLPALCARLPKSAIGKMPEGGVMEWVRLR